MAPATQRTMCRRQNISRATTTIVRYCRFHSFSGANSTRRRTRQADWSIFERLSDLRWRLATNVITTTFKFRERFAFEFIQRFLARNARHDVWGTFVLAQAEF